MTNLSFLKDKQFLKDLDNDNNKFYWVKIEVLDFEEYPIQSIEGRVQPGSTINIDGNSSMRRTCSISFIAEDADNDLTNVENLLAVNKKVRIFEGIKNNINNYYDDIIWFPLGIFVITQPSISNSGSGCIINLSCKDKMCLLNGECAGNLPTSITFHEYDQIIGLRECITDPQHDDSLEPNNYTIYHYNNKYYSWSAEYGWTEEKNANAVGERVQIPQRFYDIIQTLVCNFGGESLSKIFINDVPLEIKQIVRYVGNDTLYYNSDTDRYTTDDTFVTEDGEWRHFEYNEDVGYVYTDFVYPGTLISNIGDNICTILDKIKNTLGNYEYFYDIDGNFVFQEIKNYLNTSYDPTDKYRLDNLRKVDIAENGLAILNHTNYEVDFYSNTKSVYTFEEGNGLIASINNAPNYINLKNDFHIWGENSNGYAIHYHVAIKNKPIKMNTYSVVFIQENGEYTGGLRLAEDGETGVAYTPLDWRAELYLQGLTKWKHEQRPDVYEQELLDLFDLIYNFYKPVYDQTGTRLIGRGAFRTFDDIPKVKVKDIDNVLNPNDLTYFFDYLEPINNLYDCSVDTLNTKVYSYKQDKLNRLYNTDIPDVIMLDLGMAEASRNKIIERCNREGQVYTNVDSNIYAKVAIGTTGYTAQEVARDLLYQYTNYNESINLQSIPIYYLDVNSRITVNDSKSGIYGDYIIKSISLPLSAENTMTIAATRALERI